MRRPLLVAVAHGTDLLSFLLAFSLYSIHGEGNTLMQLAYGQFGLVGVVGLKASGTAALAFLTALRPWALLPAAGAGLVGATVNIIAVTL